LRLNVRLASAVLCAACCLAAWPASAGPPSPANCSLPSIINACPSGDIAYTVIVRNAAYDPYYDSQVVLDFSGCPGVHLCPPNGATRYVFLTPTSVAITTDFTGTATFWLEAGGSCAAGVQISASEYGDPTRPTLLTNGIDHMPVSFAGLDQDGDLAVMPADATVLAAKAPEDPTADLNADGTHDAADAALLAAHLGHVCAETPTPTRPRSWGGIKLIYR
jgi:hypothetical protein